MAVPPRRCRGIGMVVCAALSLGTGKAVAQVPPVGANTAAGTSSVAVPQDAPTVTYTPMRRAGSTTPLRPVPAPTPPPAPAAAVLPSGAPAASPGGQVPMLPPASPGQTSAVPSAREAYVPASAPYVSPVPWPPAIGAGQGGSAAQTVAAAARPVRLAPRRGALGLGLDVGAPDGVALGLVVAPATWMRLHAAFGTNTASLGYRGGVTFVPVGFGPSFTFEAGHCNMAETNSLIRAMFRAPTWAKPYVQKVGYTYFNGHVGVDYVRGNFTLFLHGGYTYLMGTVSSSEPVVVDSKSNTTAMIAESGKISAHSLSAKLGMVYMFGGS